MDRTFLLRKRAITTFLSRKRAITTFLSRKFMITRSSIAFEDFLGSSIAPQVMPPWAPVVCYIEHQKESKTLVSQHWRFNSGSSKGSVVEKHKAIASVLSKRSYNFLYKISTNVSLHLFCARIGIGRTRFFSSNCSAMMIQ